MPRKVTPSPIKMTSFLEYPNGAFCNVEWQRISVHVCMRQENKKLLYVVFIEHI
jgi:hypothetical protein